MSPEMQFLNRLKAHGVPFVVVGGHAVNFHGYRRATEDVDVVWLRSPAAEEGLLRALSEVDAQYITTEIDPATGLEKTRPVSLSFIQSQHLMMLWTRIGFVDLFDYIPGSPDTDVNQLMETSEEDAGIRFTSLPWLRRMKNAAGRAKDKIDLENLTDPPRPT